MDKRIRHLNPRFILLLLSIFLALLIGEMALRIYFRHFQDYDIEMWRYALELKTGVDDERSHIHIPNTSSVLMGVPVQINSKGLRDYEYTYEKPVGTYRILVLGDSITFGWGVAFEKTFPKLLEAMLRERNNQTRKYTTVEVINAGIGNYNTRQELASLRKEGMKYEPDEVLLIYYLSDSEKTQKEVGVPFGIHKSIIRAFLVSVRNKIFAVLDARRRYNFYYRDQYSERGWGEHQKILLDFAKTTKDRGIRLTVLIFPELHDLKDYQFLDIHKKITGVFRGHGSQVLDLLDIFKGKEADQFWVARDDPHPNTKAHQLTADFIFKEIKNRF